MEVDITWLAVPTIVALSVASERLLERAAWFQRQSPETKRLLALLVAVAIGFTMAQAEKAAGANEDLQAVYSVIAALVQQFAHAIKSAQNESSTKEK